jgi:uncharacterized protein HemX
MKTLNLIRSALAVLVILALCVIGYISERQQQNAVVTLQARLSGATAKILALQASVEYYEALTDNLTQELDYAQSKLTACEGK